MSSTYSILCLSHPRAVVLPGQEWHSGDDGREVLERAVDHGSLAGDDQIIHAGHDLIGGRFSDQLVEVYCPSAAPADETGLRSHARWHRFGEWYTLDWLALLYGAQLQGADTWGSALKSGYFQCWPVERLAKLAHEFDPHGQLQAMGERFKPPTKPIQDPDVVTRMRPPAPTGTLEQALTDAAHAILRALVPSDAAVAEADRSAAELRTWYHDINRGG